MLLCRSSTLINGKGRSPQTPTAELSVITVTPGKRYRFRVVSLSCDPNFLFSIDGHDLTIIEADSVNTEPLVVDSIQIYAGQRYSFVLNANQQVDNYCACYILCDRSLYAANLLVLGIRAFPNSSSDNPEALTFVERRCRLILLDGVGRPITDFVSKRELLSAIIDIVEGMP